MTTPAFTGFTEAALACYDDLEIDNSTSFWTAARPLVDWVSGRLE